MKAVLYRVLVAIAYLVTEVLLFGAVLSGGFSGKRGLFLIVLVLNYIVGRYALRVILTVPDDVDGEDEEDESRRE